MTTVANILTAVGYDLKLTVADAAARQAELISYMNRIITNHLVPSLARFKSDLGMKAWTTTESTANLPSYTLPTDFYSFYALYAKKYYHAGALTDTSATATVYLDATASSTDDAYNGMLFRLTSGTYADSQAYITDYTGSTKTAVISPSPGTTTLGNTYVIVERFMDDDELQQVEVSELFSDYTDTADTPEVYSLMMDTSLMIGPCPNSSEIVFYGLYFYKPTALSTTTDTLPFHGIFDELIRQYTSQIGMLRDEYNVSVEETIRSRIEADVYSIIKERVRKKPGVGQSKISGSND